MPLAGYKVKWERNEKDNVTNYSNKMIKTKKLLYIITTSLICIPIILFFLFCFKDGEIDCIHIVRITKNVDYISGLSLMDLYLDEKISPEEYQAIWEVKNKRSLEFFRKHLELLTSEDFQISSIDLDWSIQTTKDQIERLENAQSLVGIKKEIVDKHSRGLTQRDREYLMQNVIGHKSFDWNEYYKYKRKYDQNAHLGAQY